MNRTENMMFSVKHLGEKDLALMKDMLRMFADVFGDPQSYQDNSPDDAYLSARLEDDGFIALVAHDNKKQVVGGLAAYVLRKFEQKRSEIYIYDLAVDAAHRRKGIATALIDKLREIGRECGAWVIFVQADIGDEDVPANALYQKLAAKRITANHYDILP